MLLKKIGFIILCLTIVAALSSCAKKQPPLEEMQQPISPEELSRLTAQNQNVAVAVNEAAQTQTLTADKKTEQIPQASVSVVKPTNQDIQAALKNAGYYDGAIDGKLGPKSKKAIEDFQKASGLNADGKVGAKTWAVLSAHLAPVESVPAKGQKNRY